MDYAEIKNYEKALGIKNEADKIYKDFMDKVKLPVKGFKDDKFLIENDGNNQKYIYIENKHFVYECCFLHEHYVVNITPEGIYKAIQEDSKGVGHLRIDLMRLK